MERLSVSTTSSYSMIKDPYRACGVLAGVALASLGLYALNRARFDSASKLLMRSTGGALLVGGMGLAAHRFSRVPEMTRDELARGLDRWLANNPGQGPFREAILSTFDP
jgi:hypothetical protein